MQINVYKNLKVIIF